MMCLGTNFRAILPRSRVPAAGVLTSHGFSELWDLDFTEFNVYLNEQLPYLGVIYSVFCISKQ